MAWRQTDKGKTAVSSRGHFLTWTKPGKQKRIEEVAQRITEVSSVDDAAQLQFLLRRQVACLKRANFSSAPLQIGFLLQNALGAVSVRKKLSLQPNAGRLDGSRCLRFP